MDAIATTVAVRANGYLEAMIATPSLAGNVEHGVMQLDAVPPAADAGELADTFFMALLLSIRLRVVFRLDAFMFDDVTH